MLTCCILSLIVVSYQIATCLVASISAYFSTQVTSSHPHSTATAVHSCDFVEAFAMSGWIGYVWVGSYGLTTSTDLAWQARDIIFQHVMYVSACWKYILCWHIGCTVEVVYQHVFVEKFCVWIEVNIHSNQTYYTDMYIRWASSGLNQHMMAFSKVQWSIGIGITTYIVASLNL